VGFSLQKFSFLGHPQTHQLSKVFRYKFPVSKKKTLYLSIKILRSADRKISKGSEENPSKRGSFEFGARRYAKVAAKIRGD